jgi:hypothetical protein
VIPDAGTRLLPGGRFGAGSSLSFLAGLIEHCGLPVQRLGRERYPVRRVGPRPSGELAPQHVYSRSRASIQRAASSTASAGYL